MSAINSDITLQIASQCSLPITFSEALDYYGQTSYGSALLVAYNIEDYEYLASVKNKHQYLNYSFFVAPSGFVFEIERDIDFSSLELAILHLKLEDIKLESSVNILNNAQVDEEFINEFIAFVETEKYKYSPLYFNKTAREILDAKRKQKALEKSKGKF